VPSSIFFFAAKGASCVYPPENPLSFCEKTIFGSSGSLAVIIPYSFVGCNRFARKIEHIFFSFFVYLYNFGCEKNAVVL